MSQLSVKINLDAGAYSDGLRQATASTKEYTNQLTNITKNLPNAKREMNQMRKEAANLALVISRMSEAEKQSAEGQALIQHFHNIREEGAKMIDTIGDINAEMRAMASDTAGLDAARQAVGMFGNALSSVAGVIGLVTGEEEKMKKAVVMFTTVQSTLNTITSISTALNKSSILVLKTKALQQRAAAMAVKMETIAQNGNIITTKAATLAQKAFNAVVKANPIGLLITALVTVVSLFTAFASGADDATDSMGSLKEGENDLATETGRLKDAQEKAGEVAGELSSKYEVLRMKYLSCKTDMERTQFIQQNKTGFEELGVEVNNLTDAYDFLVRKAPEVRRALMMISVAKGMQHAIEDYSAKWAESQAQNPISQPDLGYEARFKVSKLMNGGYNFLEDWMYEAGITNANIRDFDSRTNTGKLDLQGIGKARNYFANKNAQEERERQNEFLSVINQLREHWEKADAAAAEAAEYAGINYANGDLIKPNKSNNSTSTSTSGKNRTRTRTTTSKSNTTQDKPKKTVEEKKNDVKEVKSARVQELESLGKREKTIIDQMYDLEKANKKDTQEYRNKEVELLKIKKRVEDINNIGNIKDQDELDTAIDRQKKHIEDLEAQKKKLQGDNGNPIIGSEEEWEKKEAEISEANDLLEYMQSRLDGIKMTKLDELEKTFKTVSEKYREALENDPQKLLDSTKQLAEEYKTASKNYNDFKEKVEEELNIVVDIKEDYLKKKVKEFKDNIEEIDLEIELNPELSPLDKGKLQNQKNEYQREYNKWLKQLRTHQGVIDEDDMSWSNPNDPRQLKDVVSLGKQQVSLDVQINKIDWSKAAEGVEQGFNEKSVMGDNMKMLYDTKTSTLSNITSSINAVKEAYKDGIFGDGKEAREQAQKYIDNLNEYLQNLELDPIEVNLKTDDFNTKIANISNTIGQLGNAVGEAFDAMNDMFKVNNDDKDSKPLQAGKIIAQAIATLALSFAQAMSHEKTIWTWIAGGISGMATLLSMTASLKKLNQSEGYAEGGIVGGHSYYGDKIIARVNSQEAIFTTQQQKRIWEQMNTPNDDFRSTHVVVEGKIRGSDIILMQKNYNSKSNKAR